MTTISEPEPDDLTPLPDDIQAEIALPYDEWEKVILGE